MINLFRRLRQVHAIEHATVAVLFERRGGRKMRVGGLSHPWGFLLVSPEADGQAVTTAAAEAVHRLNTGQAHLAVSDYCGTNLAIAAVVLTTVVRAASWRGGSFSRSVLTATAAMVLVPVAGQAVQQSVTTLAPVRERVSGGARRLAGGTWGTLHHVPIR